MWNPKSLRITNLFSYKQSFFEFTPNQTTMVYGINKTEDNVHSNRSGKTSILDCITIALTGEPLRDIKKAEIVRNGEKSGELELELENLVLGKNLLIKWEINSTKSNNALIWVNGIPDNSLKDLSPKETTDYILRIIGINKEDLINYFLISKDSFQPFFTTGDTAKKEIINRFSKANIVDPIEPLIKADIELLDSTLNELKNQKASNDGVLAHLDEEKTKEQLESSIKKTRDLTIKSLEEKKEGFQILKDKLPELIKNKKKEKFDKKSEIDALQAEIDKTVKAIEKAEDKETKLSESISKQQVLQDEVESTYKPKFKIVEDKILKEEDDLKDKLAKNTQELTKIEDKYAPLFKKNQEEIDTCNEEIKECEDAIKEQDKKIGEIEKNLADKIDCPKCKHSFIIRDDKYDLKDAAKELIAAKNTKKEIQELIKESETTISELNDKEVKLKTEKLKKIADNGVERTKLRTDSESRVEKLEEEVKKLKTELADKVKNIVEKKSSLKTELESIQSEITKLVAGKKEKNSLMLTEQTKMNTIILEENDINTKASFYDTQMKECDKAIKEENEKKYEDPLTSIEEKINVLTKQNEELQVEIDGWEADKGNLMEWQVRFKQFKSFLANTSISAIEEMTNFFLSKMRTNLTVMINGYRELSNKKLKEEIETLVCRDGLNGERIQKFSGEEKCEINLAAILAFQKIINIASPTGGLNLLFIDEILESADSKALGYIIKSLIPLEQTIFIITHVSPDTIFECNQLKVEKVNGISTIINNIE